ncbi:carbohydrate ABC transporter permease [Paenibacillus sp. GXUN7292]|uniref:carbohydrate ABC transporter permease n=1 Tax=Paenibacillus sp. GXUN7292 TaxID=3422499 RepID=UPI003D7E5FD2
MKVKLGTVILYTIMSLCAIVCLIPFVLVLSASLTDQVALAKDGYQLIPEVWSLKAYEVIILNPAQLLRSYGVSITVTVLGTTLSIIFSTLLAYPLSRPDFAYRNPLSFYIFFTMLFNGGLVPFYILLSQYLSVKDTILALILPGMISPFFIILIRTFFQTIPYSLIELGMLEGASEIKIYFRIIVPLSAPILATISLFTSLGYWNDWFNSLLFINKTQLYPLQYMLMVMMQNIEFMLKNAGRGLNAADIPMEPVRMAMAIIAIGPMAFVYLYFQKYFVKGIIIGAVKG